MAWCLAFRSDGLHCRVDGTATLMAKHDNQSRAHDIDTVLDASQAFIVEHIARDSNAEQISEALIKDDFGWHTRIGTTENDRKRMLTFCQFCASFAGLLAGHSQRNRTGVFIAVGRHVFSFINRFVWMLRISGGKSAIAFLQPRDRFGRRNNWLIGMSRISSAGELVGAQQSDYDKTRCELCLIHAGIYERTRSFDQFQKQMSREEVSLRPVERR